MSAQDEALFNKGLKIEFYNVIAEESVSFKAWITGFEDSFPQRWREENVHGRNDPHQVFEGTSRIINLSWMILSNDISEARENLRKMGLLSQMSYPAYDSARGDIQATSISASPLFRLKFLNLIQDVSGFTGATSAIADARDSGLVGRVDDFTHSINFDVGVFEENGNVYPKEASLSCVFHVLHTHDLGWIDRHFRKGNFPYGDFLGDVIAGPAEIEPPTESIDPIITPAPASETDQQRKASENAILEQGDLIIF